MLLSAFFFIAAFYLYSKSRFSVTNAFVFVILALVTTTMNIIYGISDYFTGNGITDASVYAIQYGIRGAGLADYKIIIGLSIAILLVVLAALWTVVYKTYTPEKNTRSYSYIAFLFLIFAILCSPAVTDLYRMYVAVTDSRLLKYKFDDFYKKPVIEQIGRKRNLVFIYGEGLEQTFSNKEIFPNLTQRLDDFEKRSIFFTNIRQPSRASFTIAGFVASQCGFSFVSSTGNSLSGMDNYLPGATCLGDLLKEKGYFLTYYGGANLTFSGKGTFLKTHGFDETYGQQEILPTLLSPSYKTSWGLYDDTLFDISYQRFLELSQRKDNFALFMLTLDTHQSDPQQSKSCEGISYSDGSSPMLNSVACSDYLISNFIHKIIDSPYGEDTVIVLASDHLGLRSSASDILNTTARRNRLMIISPDITMPHEVKRLGSTLDTGTTILPFIGFKGDIGLGRNLLNPQQEESEIKTIQDNISYWKKEPRKFWNFPKIEDPVHIDIPHGKITINNRKFNIPILIELESDLQTNLVFEMDHLDLPDTIQTVPLIDRRDTDFPFLLIDKCTKIPQTKEADISNGFCLASGDGETYSVTSLDDNSILTTEDVRRLTRLSRSE